MLLSVPPFSIFTGHYRLVLQGQKMQCAYSYKHAFVYMYLICYSLISTEASCLAAPLCDSSTFSAQLCSSAHLGPQSCSCYSLEYKLQQADVHSRTNWLYLSPQGRNVSVDKDNISMKLLFKSAYLKVRNWGRAPLL